MMADRWTLPDGMERCPTCGRFVTTDDGYGDIAPGGIRGVSYLSVYCDATCAADVRCAHGKGPREECGECPY